MVFLLHLIHANVFATRFSIFVSVSSEAVLCDWHFA
jgi:hypothetical protein